MPVAIYLEGEVVNDQNILDLHKKQKSEDVELLIAQVYDLAMLTCRAFDQVRMARFLDRSNQILSRVNINSTEESLLARY